MLAVFTIFFQTYRVVLYLSIFEGRHRCSFTVNVIEQKMKKKQVAKLPCAQFWKDFSMDIFYFKSNISWTLWTSCILEELVAKKLIKF